MPFTGLGPQTLPFFKALGFHQTKAWFEENRAIYETEVKAPLGDLVEELSAELQKRKIPVHGDRKKAIFRLHRDTRFAKDKSPYKTNAGFVLNRDGTRGTGGMVYVHIDPEGCFVAAGWYMPEPPALAAIRAAIAKNPRAFIAMEAVLKSKKLKLSDEYTLKRTPKGYEGITDDKLLTAIKRTALLTSRPIPDTDIHKPRLVKQLADFTESALPLLQFGWKATA
ncbi:MAG: TIGR02453 family protein [Micropepsaceae bacterium]